MDEQNKQIGQKIRELRHSRGMTQAELVGDSITRNMLSLLETGSAAPSLHTLTELSRRLDVPVGYFFASTDEESSQFTKMGMMKTLHQLFLDRDYPACIASCETLPHPDDEILFLLLQCHFRMAEKALHRYALRTAAESLMQAETYASRCIYTFGALTATTRYLLLLVRAAGKEKIPPQLISPDALSQTLIPPEWFVYLRCLSALENGDVQTADTLQKSGLISYPCYVDFIKACILMTSGATEEAFPLLKKALAAPNIDFFSHYHILTALESCASKISDYKAAYQYSAQKVHLLETFTK